MKTKIALLVLIATTSLTIADNAKVYYKGKSTYYRQYDSTFLDSDQGGCVWLTIDKNFKGMHVSTLYKSDKDIKELVFKVKSPGNVYIISFGKSSFPGWELVSSNTYGWDMEGGGKWPYSIFTKYLEVGEYSLPIGQYLKTRVLF